MNMQKERPFTAGVKAEGAKQANLSRSPPNLQSEKLAVPMSHGLIVKILCG